MSRIRKRPGRLGVAIGVALAVGVATTAVAATPPVLSKGPNGEKPTAASKVVLTPAEVAKVKAMRATAAIVMHYGGDDWSRAQIAGQKFQFKKLGIRVIATTDAGFKPEKQVSDIETVLAKKPDIIVSIPTDPVATAGAYTKAAKAGVKIVFMMGQALGGKGEIGIIYHKADFFVTKQRWVNFKSTIRKSYPNIKIAEEQGIGGPDFAGDAEKVASAMLTRRPNLDGIWAVWDVPAEGVISAARTTGRDDLVITTIDLGLNVAIQIAKKELVYGLGAQRPFDQGVAEAKLAAYGLLGKKAPAYVALPALPVTNRNVLQAWQTVYHVKPPKSLVDAKK
jgi:ribose transport system substrate-binding protein